MLNIKTRTENNIGCGCSELLELLERIYLKSNEKGATLVLEHTRG